MKDLVYLYGQMDQNMKGILKRKRNTEEEFRLEVMGMFLKENFRMDYKKDLKF